MRRSNPSLDWDRPVTFTVKINVRQLIDFGCDHEAEFGVGEWVPGCRCCDANRAIVESGMKINWWNDPEGWSRTLAGTAVGKDQKVALTRMIAFAYGHPDPMRLEGAADALR